MNQNSASLNGYVYSVKDSVGNPLGWWPFDTTLSQMQFAYTILRHNTAFQDTLVSVMDKDAPTTSLVTIYPNPTGNLQKLTGYTEKPERLDIRLYDVTGKLMVNVFEGNSIAGKNAFQVSIGDLAGGVYLYIIKRGDKSEYVKMVKL